MSSSSLDDDDDWLKLRFKAIFVFFFTGDVSEFDDECSERLELFRDIARVRRGMA